MMIFEYEELKDCVREDFERFYKMGFSEKQIFPAVLNEYEHGEDFCSIENICIHVFLILMYADKNLNCNEILDRVNQLLTEETDKELEIALGNKYPRFVEDLNNARNC